MTRKWIVAAMALQLALSGCVSIDRSKPPEPDAIKVPGHPYWTVPNCRRNQPFGKWDNNCDVPYVGLPRGFANSDFWWHPLLNASQ
jgi:hypothetical protein